MIFGDPQNGSAGHILSKAVGPECALEVDGNLSSGGAQWAATESHWLLPFGKGACDPDAMINRVIPRVAPYHCGPYKLAGILQDPGTIHGSSCNAQLTGEVGVLNGDPTANLCRDALLANGIEQSAYLPLNAVPWYDAPTSHTNAILREGAHYNRELILLHGVKLVLLLGGSARKSLRWLNLPDDIETRCLPHPGRLGLINFKVDGAKVGHHEARRILIEGFALRALPRDPRPSG